MKLLADSAINFDQLKQAIITVAPDVNQNLFKGASGVYPILSTVMKYLYVIAGLILLFYLIYGGFQMMTGARDEKGLMAAKGRITNALIGFLLLFVSYWIVQIMEYVLGIQIF